MKFKREFFLSCLTIVALAPLFANKPTPVNRFYVAEGLEAKVWAQAPLFMNPTNMDTDLQGRIWVTEAVNYRSFRNQTEVNAWHQKGDRIMVLEDTDHDGQADSSHVFVQDADLVAPMGLSVFDNRIIVTCSPNIISYTDVDRDSRFDPKIDRKEILLTGFGGFDHDHSLHTVKAGPDGDLYFTTGNAGPHIVTDRSGWTLRAGSSYRGGSPYNTENQPGLVSDDGRIYVGGLAARMSPDGTHLRIIGHNFRNPYELCLDSFGNVFQNDNDDTISCRTTWIMEYGNLGFSSNDGTRAWRADQRPGQSTPTAHWRQEDPGIIPAGDIYGPGSPTGIEFYENGALGDGYDNRLLSCEAGRNAVFMYTPQVSGAGYELRRSTLFSSVNPKGTQAPLDKEDTRKWFRPSDVLVGADGAIYVSDFYDPFIGGHRMLEPNGFGTIYRITRKGTNPLPPKIDIDRVTGQIAALRNPASSVRYAGFKRLTDRPTASGATALLELSRSDDPRLAARALYALARIGSPHTNQGALAKKSWQRVEQALRDPNPLIRITAYRATRQNDPRHLLQRARRLTDDPSIAVRREVALSLRDLPLKDSKAIILELAETFDGKDRWFLEALGAACEGKEQEIWKALARNAPADPLQWNAAFAALTWRLHPSDAIEPLSRRAREASLPPQERRRALDALAFIPERDAGEAVLGSAIDGPADTRAYATWWVNARSRNDWADFGLASKLPADVEALEAAKEDRKMSGYRNKLKNAPEPTDEIIQMAIEMAQSPIGASYLLHTAGRNELPGFLIPVIAQRIHENPDLSIRALASRYFPKPGATAKSLPPIGDIVNLKGDPEKGRELFLGRAACATCHSHGSQGQSIGPDLTEVGSRFDRTALLDSILNPSAAIAFGYEATVIETNDGSTFSGFIIGEGQTLLLKDIAGQQHSIPQSNIRSREKLATSIMPSGEALGLSAQDLANVVSFLTGSP